MWAGLGTAAGVLLAALLAPSARGGPIALLLAAGAGLAAGWLLGGWPEAVGAAAGGVAGALGGSAVVHGSLRRGGTRGGTALLVAAGALALAVLAFVPVLGVAMALVVPLLALRSQRRAGERYAGLRTLARD